MIYTLNIEKIKSVYVLSSEAKDFYKTKVNQKVNFQITPFKRILREVLEFKEKEDRNQGINILSKQFDFINKDRVKEKLNNNFEDDFLKVDNYLSSGFKSFYLDLFLYKRENIFPKDDIGYIYDLTTL